MPVDATDRLYAYEHRRNKQMPELIEAAERKLAGLYREAARYGRHELLKNTMFTDEAWDHEVRREQLRATLSGEPSSIGNTE